MTDRLTIPVCSLWSTAMPLCTRLWPEPVASRSLISGQSCGVCRCWLSTFILVKLFWTRCRRYHALPFATNNSALQQSIRLPTMLKAMVPATSWVTMRRIWREARICKLHVLTTFGMCGRRTTMWHQVWLRESSVYRSDTQTMQPTIMDLEGWLKDIVPSSVQTYKPITGNAKQVVCLHYF